MILICDLIFCKSLGKVGFEDQGDRRKSYIYTYEPVSHLPRLYDVKCATVLVPFRFLGKGGGGEGREYSGSVDCVFFLFFLLWFLLSFFTCVTPMM